ncbi:MAG: 50S ribosomal protein L23 [Candidatus Sungbacteria bacterium]|nr:50S ribosomal protein L23 [Candidatus Sungbacteria bacterium]
MSLLRKILTARSSKAPSKPAEKQPRQERPLPEAHVSVWATENRKNLLAGPPILYRSHITEKTSLLAGRNTYSFVIAGHANSNMVKKAVAGRFGVEVSAVRVANMPGKERRRGRQIGWKPGFKKAMVTIKEGQTIEVQ